MASPQTERSRNTKMVMRVFLAVAVGALLGLFGLTFVFILLSSREAQLEAGVGWGVLVLFLIAPINAVPGAFFGLAIGLERLFQRQGKITKSGWPCLITGAAIVGVYLLCFALTGFPGFSGAHHISVLTGEPTTQIQDIRDTISYCGPLWLGILWLIWGAKQVLSCRAN